MPKDIVYDADARAGMLNGLNKLAQTVRSTFGPRGLFVMLETSDSFPQASNDGAAIAAQIVFEDSLENAGAQIIKELTARTKELAGDGTTTATVLAHYLITEGFKAAAAGADPLALRRGMQGAAQVAAAALGKLALPVSELASTTTSTASAPITSTVPTTSGAVLASVAAISAKDQDIGRIIAEAIEKVGPYGVITIDESDTLDSHLEISWGMQFERGFIAPEMANDTARSLAELTDAAVLITDHTINDLQPLLPLLEAVARQNRPLLIIAEAVEGAALGTLLLNNRQGVLRCVAVHPPAYGEGRVARMDDLALFTGGTFLAKEQGYQLKDATPETLGRVQVATVTRNKTVLAGGAGGKEKIEERVAWLKRQIEKSDYDFAKGQLEERLAKFAGGVALVRVGAATKVEQAEKKQRYKDALAAARAALAEGVLPGGGVAYMAVCPAVQAYVDTLEADTKTGAAILLRALERPLRQIAANAHHNEGCVVAAVRARSRGTGFNAITAEYVKMVDAGIVDAAKVTRLALLNAVSIAATLLTTQAVVTDTPQER